MNSAQKKDWIWQEEEKEFTCRECVVKAKYEQVKYEKEREFYGRAKKQVYPRTKPKITLRRIHSNEEWQGTQSFYESWRMPSALKELVETALSPLNRKGTGFAGGDSGDGTQSPEAGGVGESGAGPSRNSGMAIHMEILEEEAEIVEEESLGSECSSDSAHGLNARQNCSGAVTTAA